MAEELKLVVTDQGAKLWRVSSFRLVDGVSENRDGYWLSDGVLAQTTRQVPLLPRNELGEIEMYPIQLITGPVNLRECKIFWYPSLNWVLFQATHEFLTEHQNQLSSAWFHGSDYSESALVLRALYQFYGLIMPDQVPISLIKSPSEPEGASSFLPMIGCFMKI